MNGYYKSVSKLLKEHGFSYIKNGKGSHEIWGKEDLKVLLPFNCQSKFTANAVLKEAGIKHKF